MAALSGKRILITGAAGGIGQSLAAVCSKEGAVVGRHLGRSGDATQDDLSFSGDLTEANAAETLIEAFCDTAGGLDVLVNNAGTAGSYTHFEDLPLADWDNTIALNATVPFRLSRAAWPHLKDSSAARIINISTAALGYAGSSKAVHYLASKAALEAQSHALAKAGAADGISVNVIRCGVIDTPMRESIPGYSEEQFQKRVAMIPMGRAGTPEDIAAWVVHLAGDGGAFTTGQTITVAGGDR